MDEVVGGTWYTEYKETRPGTWVPEQAAVYEKCSSVLLIEKNRLRNSH